MLDPKRINEAIQGVMESLPPGLKNAPQEVRSNVQSLLLSVFERLDLVTREEFDAQAAVLAKTREKLEALEKQLAELEKKR